MSTRTKSNFVVYCRENGKIDHVLSDELLLFPPKVKDKEFWSIFKGKNHDLSKAFFEQVCASNIALGHDISFEKGGEKINMYMAGCRVPTGVLVAGSESYNETTIRLFEEMVKMYEEQVHSLRQSLKVQTLQEVENSDGNDHFDFARMNTEISNLQRELMKKNMEIEKIKEQLQEQSIRDSLTGLYNRRYLKEFLNKELKRASRREKPLCIVLFDIDNFKDINDTYGHFLGDTVIKEISRTLTNWIRGGDIAVRFGGDEILLIMVDAPKSRVVERINQIRELVSEMVIKITDHQIKGITVSAGIAEFPTHAKTDELLLKAADFALYQAKAEGRNRVIAAD